LFHLRAEFLINLERGADALLDFWVEPFAEILFGDAESQRLERLVDGLAVLRRRLVHAGAVERIMPRDDFEKQGDVGHFMGEAADLIERTGEGNETVARHASV